MPASGLGSSRPVRRGVSTRAVLDAAEGALSAFNAPDRARDAAYARYHAALREVDALAVRCDNGHPCSTDERGNTGVVYFDGLVAAYARVWKARSGLSATNAAYVEAVGIAGAAETRERAARFRRYAVRMRRLRGNSNRILARQRVLIHASNAENDALNALHDRAIAAHVAANRAALDALGRAARALSSAAERLIDDHCPDTRAAEASRAVGRAESVAAAAAGPEVSNDSNRTDAALNELIGGDVHLSGHTVEGGLVKTAPMRLGNHVTAGLGSVIGIGVSIGSDVQIGALSLVPKHVTLDGGRIYVGVPARALVTDASSSDQ